MESETLSMAVRDLYNVPGQSRDASLILCFDTIEVRVSATKYGDLVYSGFYRLPDDSLGGGCAYGSQDGQTPVEAVASIVAELRQIQSLDPRGRSV